MLQVVPPLVVCRTTPGPLSSPTMKQDEVDIHAVPTYTPVVSGGVWALHVEPPSVVASMSKANVFGF